MEIDTATLDAQPIIEAAMLFQTTRESAFATMATTAKAAINYGTLLEDARTKLGSNKKLEKWLVTILPDLPMQESEACLRVAAKFHREGEGLFLQRSGAAWAQAELGLLPPPPPKRERKDTPLKPADALSAIERCKTTLAEVLEACPLAGWTEAERTMLHTGLAELDMIGGDK